MRSRAPDQDIHRFARDAAPTPLRGEVGRVGFRSVRAVARGFENRARGMGSGVARRGTRHALDAHELADIVRASLEVDAEVGRLGLERGPRRLAAIGGSPKRSRDVARVLETKLVANDDERGEAFEPPSSARLRFAAPRPTFDSTPLFKPGIEARDARPAGREWEAAGMRSSPFFAVTPESPVRKPTPRSAKPAPRSEKRFFRTEH